MFVLSGICLCGFLYLRKLNKVYKNYTKKRGNTYTFTLCRGVIEKSVSSGSKSPFYLKPLLHFMIYERLIARFSNASILASIGGCDENSAIIPPLSLIPKAAICSGSASGSTCPNRLSAPIMF